MARKNAVFFLIATSVILILLQALYMLATGYGDGRYWGVAAFVLLLAVISIGLAGAPRGSRARRRDIRPLAATVWVLVTLLAGVGVLTAAKSYSCLLYTSPSPRDKRQSRMPSSA